MTYRKPAALALTAAIGLGGFTAASAQANTPGADATAYIRAHKRNLNALAYKPFKRSDGSIVQPWQLDKPRWKITSCRTGFCTGYITLTTRSRTPRLAQLVVPFSVETLGKPSFIYVG